MYSESNLTPYSLVLAILILFLLPNCPGRDFQSCVAYKQCKGTSLPFPQLTLETHLPFLSSSSCKLCVGHFSPSLLNFSPFGSIFKIICFYFVCIYNNYLFLCVYIMYVSYKVFCLHKYLCPTCVQFPWRQKRAAESLELKLQTVMSHHEGSGNPA